MALDPFADEILPRRAVGQELGQELGQDLSTLSVDELQERVELLEREIRRVLEAKAKKEASKAAADAFFRP